MTKHVLGQAQQALEAVNAAWQAEQADLSQQQTDLQTEIDTLQTQRPAIAGAISADRLALYDDLRQKKAGVAVAVVKNNLCQACSIMVSNNKVRQARSGTETYVLRHLRSHFTYHLNLGEGYDYPKCPVRYRTTPPFKQRLTERPARAKV